MTTLTSITPVPGTRILGVGGVRGEIVVPNEAIIGPIDSSDEWIRQRTGIVTRRRAGAETSIEDLSVAAARDALNRAGVAAADVDVVLLSTVTYFEQTPPWPAALRTRSARAPPLPTTFLPRAPGTATASGRRMLWCVPGRPGTCW